MKVHEEDVEVLLQWAASKDVTVHIYTWLSDQVSRLIELFPELSNYITYL